MLGARHEVMVSLASTGGISHRFLLWRHDGPDFSDHDVLLLRLIRPHLVQLHDAMLQQRSGRPALTARQNEVLQMVAAGLTNGQIARRYRSLRPPSASTWRTSTPRWTSPTEPRPPPESELVNCCDDLGVAAQNALRVTSMLPRVAFEYGQNW